MQDVFTALLDKKGKKSLTLDFLKTYSFFKNSENWRLFLDQNFSNLKVLNLPKKKINQNTQCLDGFYHLNDDFSLKAYASYVKDEQNFDFSIFQINPFIEANIFFSEEILEINVPKNKTFLDIDISFTLSQLATLSSPRLKLNVAENSHLVIKLTREQFKDVNAYQNSFLHCILEEGASLSLECLDSDFSYQLTESIFVEQKKNSSFSFRSFTHGCQKCCRDIQILIHGKGCKTDIKSLALLKNDESMFAHSHLNHFEKDAFAEQSFRSVLGEQSFCEYNGLVTIQPKAHGCDSSQSNMNLILSDDARVYTRPQLKIDADDVSCGHGATVGQIDSEQINYLQTRGLSKAEATLLLLKGFIIDGLKGFSLLDDKSFIDHLDTMLLSYVR